MRNPRNNCRGCGREYQTVKKGIEGRDLIGFVPGLSNLKLKKGILFGKDIAPEPSISRELFESRSDDWLKDGWSLDVITTQKRGGLGIAKDLYENKGFEIDVGGYVTNDFKSGELDPQFGVGLNISF